MARIVGPLRVQYLTGIVVHHDCRIGRPIAGTMNRALARLLAGSACFRFVPTDPRDRQDRQAHRRQMTRKQEMTPSSLNALPSPTVTVAGRLNPDFAFSAVIQAPHFTEIA